MGIKNFSKVFKPTRTITLKNMHGKTIAVDGMTELYRAALGAKHVHQLTDVHGNPTLYIKVVLANILKWHKNDVKQIWVFDHLQRSPTDTFHNPMKIGELAKRTKRKETALDKIKSINDVVNEEPLFSDDDEYLGNTNTSTTTNTNINTTTDTSTTTLTTTNANINTTTNANINTTTNANINTTNLHSLEKQAFTVTHTMIQDVYHILNLLKIKYIEAPAGFEGEAIASYLNVIGMVDAVYSADTDPIAYGAKTLWRYNPKDKEILEYTTTDILQQIETEADITRPTHNDILKIAAIMGTDACEKTPGVGVKTVFKKVNSITLTKLQQDSLKEFTKKPTMSIIKINNENETQLVNANIEQLIDWLVEVKAFSRLLTTKQFEKALTSHTTTVKSAKPDTTVKSAKPDTTTKSAKPDTTTKSAKPDTTVKSAKSTFVISRKKHVT